ncbi:KipI antagonist [Pandoraea iniqua]|uniref:KipI antagonist n=1 Tax=Pandoraea iniqua TaxID=2508288 RepID=A0A5E4VGG2_9BURK|nr:biotin-dependent carboxyltransferase family protein [Pandoraea iniqua]VVE10105.1 KipI antagonist [Pandoraea iniqua]VVE17858.1 KipI antagonist [Pandoraea iniqua]
MIEVMSNGALNLVVDKGREAAVPLGVSVGGAMDTLALGIANLMVGNAEDCAGIEVAIYPFKLKFEQDRLVAVTGAFTKALVGNKRLPPYWSQWVRAGEVLTIEPPQFGARSYVAVAGGIDTPQVLGSRSTDIRAGFGGVDGRGLKRGDKLAIGDAQVSARRKPQRAGGFGVAPRVITDYFASLSSNVIELRCVPAAEVELFQASALDIFTSTEYAIQPESNRMGYRLRGQSLELKAPVELLSYGVVPGTVQVPPSGQPIIQLADGNTCGGYPKIANVIESDLWRLAQARAGVCLRFKFLALDDAVAALSEQSRVMNQLKNSIELISVRV